MPARPRRDRSGGTVAVAALLAGALLVTAPAPAHPQEHPEELEGLRIVELDLGAVELLDEEVLREGIHTEESRCRSWLYWPVCPFTDAGYFVETHRLDLEELARDELRIRVLYWNRGYRHAEVASEVERAEGGVAVRFVGEEGPPTVVASVAVDSDEPLPDEVLPTVELPEEGRPLDVLAVDTAEVAILAALWPLGYADASVRDTVELVDSLAADLRILVRPGPVTRVGDIHVAGNESVSEYTIRRALGLETGELFVRSEVQEAQRRLYESNMFRQALIDVPETADSIKDVFVRVREAPLRAVRAGVGVNTVDFIQLDGGFTRFNFLGGARRLDLRAGVGNLFASQLIERPFFDGAIPGGVEGGVADVFLDPTWRLSASLSQPWFISTRNSLGATVFAHRRSVPTIVIDRGYGVSLSATRHLGPRSQASLSYTFEQTEVGAGDLYFCVNFGVCRLATISALRGEQRLSPLLLEGRLDDTDEAFSPRSGYRGRIEAELAAAFTGSDYRYARIAGEAAWFVPAGPGVLATRIRAGWVRPFESTAEAVGAVDVVSTERILHPRKRFYAGGARSVRGYGENQLGPRILTVDPERLLDSESDEACTPESLEDGSCDPGFLEASAFNPRPLGGNAVVEGSAEYRIPLWSRDVTGAVFLDAGWVGDREINIPSVARWAVTPGFGIRYASPVGPIRVDLGIRPTLVERLPVVTEVSGTGGDERLLVQLETLEEYDPVADDGGFFAQIVNRLQLHLSIGEAF